MVQNTISCIYETTPARCRFIDGTIQSISILQANQFVVEYMNKKWIHATLHKFVGGHNYVCYRISLSDRLEEIFRYRLGSKMTLKKG